MKYGVLFDVALVVCFTVLVAMGVCPMSTFLCVLGPLVGARVVANRNGGGGGSAALALVLGLGALLFEHHRS